MAQVTLTLEEAAYTQSGQVLKVCCEIEVDPGQVGTLEQEPLSREVMLTNAHLVSGSVYDLIRYLDADDKLADKADKELSDLHEWSALERRIDALRDRD